MATASDLMGVGGPGRPIILDGNEFSVTRITQGSKAAFCAWNLANRKKQIYASAAEHRAMSRPIWDEVADLQERLAKWTGDQPGYVKLEAQIKERSMEARALEELSVQMVERLNADVALQQYEWMGERTDEARATVAGGIRIALLVLQQKHPELTEEDVYEFYGRGKKQSQAKELHDIIHWSMWGEEIGAEKKLPSPAAVTVTQTEESKQS